MREYTEKLQLNWIGRLLSMYSTLRCRTFCTLWRIIHRPRRRCPSNLAGQSRLMYRFGSFSPPNASLNVPLLPQFVLHNFVHTVCTSTTFRSFNDKRALRLTHCSHTFLYLSFPMPLHLPTPFATAQSTSKRGTVSKTTKC